VSDSPLMKGGVDPLKKVEASSLFGIKNVMRFSFTTPEGPTKERLGKMDGKDVESRRINQ